MPKVSIIMPVYNAEEYLTQALDSVVNQTFRDFEVICINDGSTDESIQILQSYAERDKRIKIISQSNGGGSVARNAGIKRATGEYVMFLDSDDLYASDIVASAYSRAVDTGADVVLYNFARFIGKPTRLAVTSKIIPDSGLDFFTKDTYADRFFNDFATITWNKIIKRSVIVDNKLAFDMNLSHNHDVDFSIRLMLAAESYSWLDEIGYYYRSNDGGLTATSRSDPTNVLKILIKLDELFVSSSEALKRSFDNYIADMIAGTLVKYSNAPDKQKEVFNFAYSAVIPKVGLDKRGDDYLFTQTADIFRIVKAGNYDKYIMYANTLKRKLHTRLRKVYDTLQSVLSRFTV